MRFLGVWLCFSSPVCEFRRIDSSNSYMNLGCISLRLRKHLESQKMNVRIETYCLVGQLLSGRGNSLPRQPVPASYPPTRRMEQPEVICIADARNAAKQASSTKVARLYVVDAWNPP